MARSSKAQRQRRFENLEAKQMMAGDVLQSLATESLVAPIDDPAVEAVMIAVNNPDAAAARAGVSSMLAAALGRGYDGTGNNLNHIEWGSVGEQLLRMAEAQYDDGASTLAGADRPSPREISNALAAQDPDQTGNDRGLSSLVYLWGQFIDHDIDLSLSSSEEYEPIAVPTGDPLFDPNGSGTASIPFTRSAFDPGTGDSSANPRQQVNNISTWIDGSQVYGSDQDTADSLREFAGGRMRIGEDGLPPMEDGSFVAGDIRANENIELTSMHALMLREHNRIAGELASRNPRLTDEQLYQLARAQVIAEIQAITFNEFLPALLGRGGIDRYTGYDPTVNPTIANEFSTAAFRLGHSLVNDDVEFFGDDGRAIRDEVALSEAFFNPALLQETGIEGILKYVSSAQAQEIDSQIVDGLRNFLFGSPGAGGLDLASLNIQRGRDHGLADYNTVRAAYGLESVTTFSQISSDPAVQRALEQLYGTVDNIDLWVGALAEDHVAGASVGELTGAIIADQFTRLRDGDRFWYQNVYQGRELAQIERTTLSDVIERNTNLTNLQENVFFMNASVGGRVVAQPTGPRGTQAPQGIARVTVELLDDEGTVIDTTLTDTQGRYRFTTFRETGDYRVRVTTVLPVGSNRAPQQIVQTADVLISRGGMRLERVDFTLPAAGRRSPAPPQQGPLTAAAQMAAIDAALAEMSTSNLRRTARR